ncbi:hypothetical protein WA016_04166 [Myxococcus stipitatus]
MCEGFDDGLDNERGHLRVGDDEPVLVCAQEALEPRRNLTAGLHHLGQPADARNLFQEDYIRRMVGGLGLWEQTST